MTTTACDDQFSAEPEPVHQPYDVAAILRKNIADLEKELQRQREQNAAATERLREQIERVTSEWERAENDVAAARSDLQSFIDSRNELMARAEAAEAELAKLREQKPVAWINLNKWTPSNWPQCVTPEEYEKKRELLTKLTAVYAAPVPAPAVPEEWREVLRECADDLAIELDQRYGDSRKYPSEQRKYESEMQPVYRARSLLQSGATFSMASSEWSADCRACAILPCSCK